MPRGHKGFCHANCNSMTTTALTPSLSENVTGSDKLPSIVYFSQVPGFDVDTMSLVQLFNRTGFSFVFFLTEQAF